MKVLVTGGTGFIGSKLVTELVKKGYQTKCLVRQNSKTDFLRDMGVELVTGDITNKDSLNGIASDVDIVYHLAAIVDHTNTTSLSQHNTVSITGTDNLVKVFLNSTINRFVYISSIAAIGIRNTKNLIYETVSCHPTTHYGAAKLETEQLLLRYFNDSGFPVNIIRPPVVYGYGEKSGGILNIARFVNDRVRRKEPFPFIGKGKNQTSLCYVNNLVEAILLAGESKYTGEIYHITDARPYTWREIITTIANALGAKLHTISFPKSIVGLGSFVLEPLKMVGLNPPLHRRRFIDVSANCALDITKAREQLGYNPSDNFELYMKETIEWYRESALLDNPSQ